MTDAPRPAPPAWAGEIAGRVRGECQADAPLAPRTSVRVGGPADLLVRPADPADLAVLLRTCAELRVPVLVLGAGALARAALQRPLVFPPPRPRPPPVPPDPGPPVP